MRWTLDQVDQVDPGQGDHVVKQDIHYNSLSASLHTGVQMGNASFYSEGNIVID